MTKIILTSIVCLALTACASGSKNITSSYVSPFQYSAYDCDQLSGEAHRINAQASALARILDDTERNDRAISAGIAAYLVSTVFLGLPEALSVAATFLGGNKQQEAEYAHLKGWQDAIQETVLMKKCKGS
jgi:hypothetical protein